MFVFDEILRKDEYGKNFYFEKENVIKKRFKYGGVAV